jgi:hypothetical protein
MRSFGSIICHKRNLALIHTIKVWAMNCEGRFKVEGGGVYEFEFSACLICVKKGNIICKPFLRSRKVFLEKLSC